MSATAPTGKVDKEDSAAGRKGANNQDVKRWATLIFVCLLLGVVTTVAVAWGIALIAEPRNISGLAPDFAIDTHAPEGYFWQIVPDEGKGFGWWAAIVRGPLEMTLIQDGREAEGHLNCEHCSFPQWTRALPVRSALEAGAGSSMLATHQQTIFIVAYGWPMPALWRACSGELTHGVGSVGRSFTWYGTLIAPNMTTIRATSRSAALLPRFLNAFGFGLDVIFYGLLWAGLMPLIQAVRRTLRTHRGACGQCGYDLTGNQSGTCSECGATTPAGAASS